MNHFLSNKYITSSKANNIAKPSLVYKNQTQKGTSIIYEQEHHITLIPSVTRHAEILLSILVCLICL